MLLGCVVQWSEAFKEGSGVGNLEKKAAMKNRKAAQAPHEEPTKKLFFRSVTDSELS